MAKIAKNKAAARAAFDGKSNLSVEDAVALVKANVKAKFDETVEIAMNLGVDHRRTTILVLIAASALIAVSTALVGPMTFLGFLVATLAYQFANTPDHRYIFPVSILTGFVVLTGAYFIMNHIFYGSGVVSIIIELVGGTVFLIVILKKGRL